MYPNLISWYEYYIPITNNTCNVVDDYCSYRNVNSVGRHDGIVFHLGYPCCIDCFYCLNPCTLVLDIVCMSCNMYYNLCKK